MSVKRNQEFRKILQGKEFNSIQIDGIISLIEAMISNDVIYADDGAITLASHTAFITKGSAADLTLEVPTPKRDGIVISIVKVSNFNHTITSAAANTIVDSYSGNIGNRLTLNSGPGHYTFLFSYDGVWYCSTSGGGSVSDV